MVETYWVIQFTETLTFYDGTNYANNTLLLAKKYKTLEDAKLLSTKVSKRFVDAETTVRQVNMVLIGEG